MVARRRSRGPWPDLIVHAVGPPWVGHPKDATGVAPVPSSQRAGGATFDTLTPVLLAVVTFQFDPYAHILDGVDVLWGSIALAATIAAALILAGLLARAERLRADDVLFIAIGIVPGAVIAGRLGFLLVHADSYGADPGALIDPARGGLDLALAVVGGLLTGAYVARLLGAPVRRWLHLAVAPVLLVLGVGKLTMVLTGTGQGLPNAGVTATAYLGPGPWGSLLPALPSDPSQAFEGIATLAILIALTLASALGAFGRHDGRLFFVAIGLWALARAFVSTTWRDPAVVAGLSAGGLLSLAIAIGCAVVLIAMTLRPGTAGSAGIEGADGRAGADDAGAEALVTWPDPESQRPF